MAVLVTTTNMSLRGKQLLTRRDTERVSPIPLMIHPCTILKLGTRSQSLFDLEYLRRLVGAPFQTLKDD